MPTYHLPIYPRPETGIYCLHTSIRGKQFKRSLHTKDRQKAIIRAIPLLAKLRELDDMVIRKFEIYISRGINQGIFKSDGTEQDNNALIKAIQALQAQPISYPVQTPTQAPTQAPTQTPKQAIQASKQLKVSEVLNKMLTLRKFDVRTKQQYTTNIKEFADFVNDVSVQEITVNEITEFQEHLIKKSKNSYRTIHNKITVLRSLFNFAIERGYYFYVNPCQGIKVLTPQQLKKSQYDIFTTQEIITVLSSPEFQREKVRDPDFYYCCLLSLITTLRAGEVSALKKNNILKEDGITYIKLFNSKTSAGRREVPLPDFPIIDDFLEYVKHSKEPDNKIFHYNERDGKGAGNAVGKKLKRLLLKLPAINKERKLVFHSLRKYFNDYMKKNKVMEEMRNQVMGHENSSINNSLYSNDFNLKELYEALSPLQIKILMLASV